LVPANSVVPLVAGPFSVTTAQDNQPSIRIEVLAVPLGASRVDQCILLGSIEQEVAPAPAGQLGFDLFFKVDSGGTIRVEVRDSQTNHYKTFEVSPEQVTTLASQGAS
jgi:molecular chaperone DnaK (HSP70)